MASGTKIQGLIVSQQKSLMKITEVCINKGCAPPPQIRIWWLPSVSLVVSVQGGPYPLFNMICKYHTRQRRWKEI